MGDYRQHQQDLCDKYARALGIDPGNVLDVSERQDGTACVVISLGIRGAEKRRVCVPQEAASFSHESGAAAGDAGKLMRTDDLSIGARAEVASGASPEAPGVDSIMPHVVRKGRDRR